MNKIFVAGGFNKGFNKDVNRINDVEIVDVSTSTISRERGSSGCRSIKDYPHTMSSGVGTYIGDHPLICGGYYSLDIGDQTNKCHEYSVVANDWTETAPMLEARSAAAAVTINSTHWWVTGGYTPSGWTKSTEIYEDGKGFKVSAMCITQDLKIIHICIYWSHEIPHKAISRYHT